jgi:hypothetical protein
MNFSYNSVYLMVGKYSLAMLWAQKINSPAFPRIPEKNESSFEFDTGHSCRKNDTLFMTNAYHFGYNMRVLCQIIAKNGRITP